VKVEADEEPKVEVDGKEEVKQGADVGKLIDV